MAKKDTTMAKKTEEFELPAGFEEVKRSGIEAWWRQSRGAYIQGILRNRREGEERAYYVFELTQPAECYQSGDEEPETYPPGTVVGFSETARMVPLRDASEGTEVAMFCLGKVKGKNGRESWDYKIGFRRASDAPEDVPF